MKSANLIRRLLGLHPNPSPNLEAYPYHSLNRYCSNPGGKLFSLTYERHSSDNDKLLKFLQLELTRHRASTEKYRVRTYPYILPNHTPYFIRHDVTPNLNFPNSHSMIKFQVTIFSGGIDHITGLNDFLNCVQMLQLPFALVPTVTFVADRYIMGEFKLGV